MKNLETFPWSLGTIIFQHITPTDIKNKSEAEKHPLAWRLIKQEGNILTAEKVSNPEYKARCHWHGWSTFK